MCVILYQCSLCPLHKVIEHWFHGAINVGVQWDWTLKENLALLCTLSMITNYSIIPVIFFVYSQSSVIRNA